MCLDKEVITIIFLVTVALIVVWLAADIAIKAAERIFGRSPLSTLTLSIFFLGAVTSFPEIAITLNALWLDTPQVALGALIGGQAFLLFLIVPVLAFLTRGIALNKKHQELSLTLALLVVLAPMLALLDGQLELWEVLGILALYGVFAVCFVHRKQVLEQLWQKVPRPNKVSLLPEILKLIGVVLILLVAGNTLVRQMVELSAVMNIPRFLLSFLLIPIAANLPELLVAIQSGRNGRKDLAVADLVGSLTFNSLLLVGLTLAYGGAIIVGINIAAIIILFVLGVLLFWWFCYSKQTLTPGEGLLLLFFYLGMISFAWWYSLQQFFR